MTAMPQDLPDNSFDTALHRLKRTVAGAILSIQGNTDYKLGAAHEKMGRKYADELRAELKTIESLLKLNRAHQAADHLYTVLRKIDAIKGGV